MRHNEQTTRAIALVVFFILSTRSSTILFIIEHFIKRGKKRKLKNKMSYIDCPVYFPVLYFLDNSSILIVYRPHCEGYFD